jgi:class 3 adenylate cyclase/tetratricopeptide (TPR) repeat protein
MDVSDSSSAGSAAAERKLVAVLVCEVSEPTASTFEHPLERDHPVAGHLGRVEAEVARHGGMVVETVGDMLVAVFGVPRAHEDDPERAVRTALAVRAALAGPGHDDAGQLRAGIAVGEAVIRLREPATGLPPEVGGEVVTAAIAVMGAAPPRAVLVTAATLRTTERAISYAPAQLLPLAGVSEPVAVWEVLGPRPQSGRAPSPVLGVGLVGREGELAVLVDRYQRACKRGRPQLVTLVGAAGIGKSRLLAELGQRVAGDPDPPVWRAGRAQPYAPGGSFGALVELVKAEAGILDSDQAAIAERKLTDAVARVVAGPAAGWVTQQLRPLVGVSAGVALEVRGEAERQDVVAAWQRFLRALADQQPLVVAVEDLHWADPLLLDVLEGLVDPALGRPLPLLIVGTARPELLDHRPNWANDTSHRTTVTLGPLPAVDTARLLEALLALHEVAVTVGADLLARVNGNPLFAEEYARLLRDRRGQPEPPPAPATVQVVIAARLDALPLAQKTVLADAAVLGQVGWVGAIAAVGGNDADDLDAWLQLNQHIVDLERKELLGRVGGSRVAGEVEVAFRHVLVRDVAYGQLPRAARAERHQRAAAWLEQLAPDRASDRAELMAHHYTQALTSARSAGSPTVDLVDRTRLALRAAGNHAAALGTDVLAARYYTQALALWPADDQELPELEFRAGEAQVLGEGTGEELLVRARDGLLAQGNRERAAEAEARLGYLAYYRGQARSAHLERALTLVADAPASHSKVVVLKNCMMDLLVADRYREALEVAREVLAMARALEDRDSEAAGLGVIGAARMNLGDPGGVADLERCVALYQEHGSPGVIEWQNNLAYSRAILGDLGGCVAARRAALDAAEHFGSARTLRWLTLEETADHYWRGHWDQAAAVADSVTAEANSGATHYLECDCRIWRGRIRLARGQRENAHKDCQHALELARASNDPQNLVAALAFGARMLLLAGRSAEAGRLVDELLEHLPGRLLKPELGVDLPICLVELGRPVEVLDGVPPSRWLEAARAFVTGEPELAAELYATIGSRPDEAYARLKAAHQLMVANRAVEANTELAIAFTFYRKVGANAHLAEAKQLLATMAAVGLNRATANAPAAKTTA